MKNIFVYVLIIFAAVSLVGCYDSKQASSDTSAPTSDIELVDAQEDTDDSKISSQSESDEVLNEEIESKSEEPTGHDTIVWIGDSLTQGSLGHDNDNLANAPYVKLANLSGRNIEGFGFYGNTAHDIFWLFRDETQKNQSIDPSKAYIFWVGANDWVNNGVVSTDAGPIIAEIDNFISHGVTDYIVIGTIARVELRDESAGAPAYKIIDEQLKNHYGSHYLDVIDVITLDGYGPDDIHLTQEAYDNVAKAVYNKLKSLNYIN